MVRYKTEPGEKEQKILAEISLNTPNNLKRRKVTSAVSAVLCVIYAAFAVWMFVRIPAARLCSAFSADNFVF